MRRKAVYMVEQNIGKSTVSAGCSCRFLLWDFYIEIDVPPDCEVNIEFPARNFILKNSHIPKRVSNPPKMKTFIFVLQKF
jgi:hypothetical protein